MAGTRALKTLALLSCLGLQAEIIDRVAVTVGNQMIADSEVRRQIRITAFLNETSPALTPDVRRQTAERLVEQILIRAEMQTARYGPPDPAEANRMLEQVKKSRFSGGTEYKGELAKYGLTEKELTQQLLWQLTFLRFLDVRFRPGVQVPETEVRDYYETQFLPEWRRRSGNPAPSLAESRDEIERILTAQRVDQALDRWLGQARTQTRILFHEEAFR